MWIIGVIIVAVFIKFLYDWNNQQSEIAQQGGMEIKYKELIGYLMSDKRSLVIDRAADAIVIGVPSVGGLSAFMITQSFGKLIVEWKLTNKQFGFHKLQWSFYERDNQQKIAEKLITDFINYQETVLVKLINFDDLDD